MKNSRRSWARLLACSVALCATLLGGCAATVTKSAAENQPPLKASAEAAKHIVLDVTGGPSATGSKDWTDFRAVWVEAMTAEAAAAGKRITVRAASAAGSTQAAQGSEAATLVVVHVNDFRWISSGARIGLGIMTGNAFVDAKARFSELPSGRALGERGYNTSSSAGQGIFSAMTDKQVVAICKEIVGEVGAR